MYYVDFKQNGRIDGFYNDIYNADDIPETAVEITEEQWLLYSSEGGRLYRRDDSGANPARLKTPEEIQQDLDDDIANTPLAPKSPDQIKIEMLTDQLTQQSMNSTAFMEFVLQTLGVE